MQVLEYNSRAGGRNWTLHGGDSYTELGGATQNCQFDKDLYLNPGPWRIPYHHHGMLDYCQPLGVQLEPFMQVNHNAYLHQQEASAASRSATATSGRLPGPCRRAAGQGARTRALEPWCRTKTRRLLLESLRDGARSTRTSAMCRRACQRAPRLEKDPGGGLTAVPMPSEPIGSA